ncbi:hypothetical protein C8R44DRAFT_946285 [Mycena epipterygia]|nr:hypothetical protein C8R44DRAFT_946285 [Mycena epipterygia]
MSAISSGKVLVSGANGYIAAWVVRTLLEQGTPCGGKHLSELFSSYGDKFELVVVPDITQDGAFDEAVKDVDAIEHTVWPFHFKADAPAELLEPAIKGKVGILESALKHGGKQGRGAPAATKCRASKTMAERGDFVEQHKSEITWDLSAMNSPFVFGVRAPICSCPGFLLIDSLLFRRRRYSLLRHPPIHDVSSAEALNTSAHAMYEAFTKPDKSAHGSSYATWRSHTCYLKGTPGARKDAGHLLRFDSAKGIRVLGIEYPSMADTAADVVKDYEAKGW